MSAPIFVDTSVLLYAVDTADEEKHRAAAAWRLGRVSPHSLTEDLSHGQDLDGVRVVSPFRMAPSDLDGTGER